MFFQGQEKEVTAVQEDEPVTQQDSAQENEDVSCKEEVSSPAVFVNTRRGRGNGTKRKISDTAAVTECDAPPSAAEVFTHHNTLNTNRTTTKYLLCCSVDALHSG